MGKRILTLALATVLAISAVWVAVMLPVLAAELPEPYTASAYYDATLEKNPYTVNNEAPWEWDYYDVKTKEYKPLKKSSSSSRGFVGFGGWGNVVAVNDKIMYCDNRKDKDGTGESRFDADDDYAGAWQRYYPVRSFTAPENGCVTLTANGAVTGAAASTGPRLRILRQRGTEFIKIWPEQGDYVLKKDEPLTFPEVKVNVRRGDILRFESDTTGCTSQAGSWSYNTTWDPVVSYNSFIAIADFQPSVSDDLPLNQNFVITTEDEMEPITESDVYITGTTEAAVRDFSFTDDNTISFAFDGLAYSGTYEVEVRGLKPAGSSGAGEIYRFTFTTITLKQYQASDYYDAAGKSNPQTVDGEAPWTWESYDLKTETYTPLSSFNSSRGYAIVGGWNAVTAVDSSTMYGDTRQDGQGGFVADETYVYAWQRYYPVRTFTVPESGKVTLSAAGGSITAPTSTAPNLRILLERNGEFTQVWPEDGWKAVSANAPVRFIPLVQNVVEGDKLHFELSAADAGTGNCWTMSADWDPIVAYNEKHPTVTGISPENGAVDVPGNTEFVVTFAEEICEPSVQDAEINSDAAVAEVWLENGNEVHILLDSTTLKENTSYTIRLKNIRMKIFDEYNSFEQCITFTTAGYTIFGEFSRSGASVILPVNNTLGESQPVSVTVLAVLCQGTPERYTVKSARYKTEVITGKRDITIALDAVPGSGEFVKAAAVTAPAFGKLLTDMAILE